MWYKALNLMINYDQFFITDDEITKELRFNM